MALTECYMCGAREGETHAHPCAWDGKTNTGEPRASYAKVQGERDRARQLLRRVVERNALMHDSSSLEREILAALGDEEFTRKTLAGANEDEIQAVVDDSG